MIQHIGKLIWNQRKRNAWIAAELFFVFIILWFIVDDLLVTAKVFFAPQGFDIEHVYQVDLGIEEDKIDSTTTETVLLLLERLKTCPDVEAACIGYAAMPFDGQNMYTSIYAQTQDTTKQKSINIKTHKITPGYMDVFKFQSVDKKTNWADKLSNRKVIVSYDMMEKIKEQGGSQDLGLTYNSQNPVENHISIGGVTTPFRGTRFQKNAVWLFEELQKEDIHPYVRFAIRVKPEVDHDYETYFIKQMENQLSIGPYYLMGLTSFKDKRTSFEFLTGEKAEAEKKLAISFFLLVNIFLGIIATFWYRTGQRTNEIGLRMALGSSRHNVKKLINTEGILLLTFICLPAIIICINMQVFELNNQYYMDYTFGRFITSMGVTYLLIAIMILFGIYIPARKASQLQPAEALHNE